MIADTIQTISGISGDGAKRTSQMSEKMTGIEKQANEIREEIERINESVGSKYICEKALQNEMKGFYT